MFYFLFLRTVKLKIGYPQTLEIPSEGVSLEPQTSSIIYFPSLDYISFQDKTKYIAPPNTLEINTIDEKPHEIIYGVLNTPTGSCNWEVWYEPYYLLNSSSMNNDNLKCIAFFAPDPGKTQYEIRTVGLDDGDRVIIYSDNNVRLYNMDFYDTYKLEASSFALFYRTDSYLVQGAITVVDTTQFMVRGEYKILVNDSLKFNILPNHYVIVHNPQHFELKANDVIDYGDGVFFLRQKTNFKIYVQKKSHNIYFSIIQPPLVNCDNVTIYDGSSAKFSIKGANYNDQCFIISSPHIMDYSLYVQGLGGLLTIYCVRGEYVTSLSDDRGFTARYNSIFLHINSATNSENSIICLQESEIVSENIENEEFTDKFVTEFTSDAITKYPKTFYRFTTGFYSYYIPNSGSSFYFNRYSLYVFHNPAQFMIKGNGISFLGNKDYVLNITDFRLTAIIVPIEGSNTNYLNISVLNYNNNEIFKKCNSLDVVVINPGYKNILATSYGETPLEGYGMNFTITKNQRICFWYAASSSFDMNIVKKSLEDQNEFLISIEDQGKLMAETEEQEYHARSIIVRWRTRESVDGDTYGGSSIIAKIDKYSHAEVGGLFRGTRSYMDFSFSRFNYSTYIYNLGVREEQYSDKPPTTPTKKLSGFQIGMIILAAIVVAIIIIVVACTIKRNNSQANMESRFASAKNSGDEMEELEPQNMYFSPSASPNNSPLTTTNSASTDYHNITNMSQDSNRKHKNPYEVTSTNSSTD